MRPGFVLGIDFGGTKIALATATPDGRTLRRARLETRGGEGAPAVVRRALEAARRLIAETAASAGTDGGGGSEGGVHGGGLLAAGVSTFGVVRGDRVVLAPNVPGWEDLPLPALLREGLGTPLLSLDNDVNAATAAELRWGRLAGVGTGVYVNVGTGLGAGIVADGRVVRGANGAAGEIGYALRSPAEPGYAAGRAPLEEYASGGGLARRGSALLGRDTPAEDLFGIRGDPRVDRLLDGALDALATAVANLAIALDPERVVLGGGMAAEPALPSRISATLAAAVPFPPVVEAGRFASDAALVGALALAVDALRA